MSPLALAVWCCCMTFRLTEAFAFLPLSGGGIPQLQQRATTKLLGTYLASEDNHVETILFVECGMYWNCFERGRNGESTQVGRQALKSPQAREWQNVTSGTHLEPKMDFAGGHNLW